MIVKEASLKGGRKEGAHQATPWFFSRIDKWHPGSAGSISCAA